MRFASVFLGEAYPPFTRSRWIENGLAYLLLVPSRSQDEYEIDAILEIESQHIMGDPLAVPLEWGHVETSNLSFVPIPTLFAGLKTRIVLVVNEPIYCNVLCLLDIQISGIQTKLNRLIEKVDQVLARVTSDSSHLYP